MTDEHGLVDGPGILESIWRYRYAVMVATLLGAALGWSASAAQAPVYASSARLFLLDPNSPGLLEASGRPTDMERYTSRQAERITSRPVLEAAAGLLGTTPESVNNLLEADAQTELNAIVVRAESGSPDAAAATANAVAEAYEAWSAAETQQEAEAAIAALERQIADLQDQLDGVSTDPDDPIAASRARTLTEQLLTLDSRAGDIAARAAILGSGVDVVEEAPVPQAPVSPSPPRDAMLIALLVGGIAAAAAYWRSGRTEEMLSSSDPAQLLGVPLLGEIPRYRTSGRSTLADRLRVGHAATEAYQFVLSSVQFALSEVGGRTILVTSATPGDGKTVTALQLAAASIRDGRRTTLIDADVRARALTGILQADEAPGLTDVLHGSAALGTALKRYRLDDDLVLPVLTAGTQTADPASLLRGTRTTQVARELGEDAEIVIYDTPPMTMVVDTTVLSPHVDGIVLVVSNQTTRSALRRLQDRLAFVSTPLLGYVYNRADIPSYSYGYGYGDGSDATARSTDGSVFERLTDRPVARRAGADVPGSTGERASVMRLVRVRLSRGLR